MVSDEWRNSAWNNEPGFKYVDSCMTSSQWWDDVKVVLDTIGPLYSVLRYVDGDEGTVAGIMPRLLSAIREMEDLFRYLRALEEAIERLAESVEDGVEAIRQIRTFISYERKFDGKLAKGAVGKMPAADWWELFGGDTPELQKFAIRIVSQPKIVDDDLCLEELLGRSKKRKILALQRANRRRKGKRVVEDEEEDFVETENGTDDSSPHGSPAYAESADSSSANDTDNEPEHRDGDTLGTHQQFEEQPEDDKKGTAGQI
ncbi:uncharacterized protein [Miscanthus floridulus]|uniref:uncharacterized protein n=1 Tax=Miscanthus floridulus TaxID=154761 RepID=UPI003458A0F8